MHDGQLRVPGVPHDLKLRGFLCGENLERGPAEADRTLAPEPVEPDGTDVQHRGHGHLAVLASLVERLSLREVERHALDVDGKQLEEIAADGAIDYRKRVPVEQGLQRKTSAELKTVLPSVRLRDQPRGDVVVDLKRRARDVVGDQRRRAVYRGERERGRRRHRRNAGRVETRNEHAVCRIVAEPPSEQFAQHLCIRCCVCRADRI